MSQQYAIVKVYSLCSPFSAENRLEYMYNW